jgi:hypothetical protein
MALPADPTQNRSGAPRRSGHALVIESGSLYSYECDVVIDAGLVHLTNVHRKLGRGDAAWLRPVDDRAWPIRRVREIRWLSARAAA